MTFNPNYIACKKCNPIIRDIVKEYKDEYVKIEKRLKKAERWGTTEDGLKKYIEGMKLDMQALEDQLKKIKDKLKWDKWYKKQYSLSEQLKKAEKVLKWYADIKNYKGQSVTMPIDNDMGQKATEYLKEVE